MTKASSDTHEFCRKKVPGDDKCLFWSFLFAMMPYFQEIVGDIQFSNELMVVLNEALRVQVADYIRRHPELHGEILLTVDDYQTMEEYYSDLEQGELWGGEPELKALSNLYGVIICVINPTIITKQNCVLPLYYGADESTASKCIYIHHNGDHYEPLYLVNKKNPKEIERRFDPNDSSVNTILKEFITAEIQRDSFDFRRNSLSYSSQGNCDIRLGLKNLADKEGIAERRISK